MTSPNGHTSNGNGSANGHLPDGGVIENFLSTLWPDGVPGRIAVCHRDHVGEFAVAKLAGSIDEAVAETLRAATESCTWFGVGAIRSDKQGGRGEFNDVVALPGLWVEIDYGKPGGPPDLAAAIAVAKSMPIPPTLIVHSGHGIHCYWLFKEAWRLSGSADRALAHSYLLGLRAELIKELKRRSFGQPDFVSDLPRVLRPAGTENWKDPNNRLPVVVVHHDDAQRYIPDDFDQYVPEPPPDPEPSAPKQSVDDPNWEIRPGDAFNAEASWAGVANLIGWKAKQLHNGRYELLRCSCEKYGKPSSSFTGKTGHKGRDRITIFSGNCWLKSEPDEIGRRPSYSKFELFAAVKFPHNERPGEGDFKAATKALIGLGFGKPRLHATGLSNGVDLRAYGIDLTQESESGPGEKTRALPPDGDEPRRPPLVRVTVRQLQADHPRLHYPVIDEWIREGETGNIISGSKIGKSWLVYYILICFVTVRAIFDRFSTAGGRALLIDNELHQPTLASRLRTVAEAMGVPADEYADRIDVLSLRGNLRSIFELGAELKDVKPGDYKLIVLDAKYRALGVDAEENSNSDETRFYNEADRLAAQTGAALLMVHHSSKGTQGEKRVTDVGAGAGAQSRAADCHLILREHEEADAIVLDAAVRSFRPLDPLCLRWRFPLWEVDESLDPTLLKGKLAPAEEKQSAKDRDTDEKVLEQCQTWRSRKELRTETGWGEERVNRAIRRLLDANQLERSEEVRRGQKCDIYRKTIHAK
ncbi:MAG: AAA family ATPase [Planctomycetaceae bacterium]|nr:AAA family ATPase [Planctomycetaceae bacterium]